MDCLNHWNRRRGGRLLCWLLPALVLAFPGCQRKPAERQADEGPLLTLGQPYAHRQLPAGGSLSYRFRTDRRGAYLIIMSDVAEPSPVTLKHPKRTCYLAGNGSCELVSSPDEAYDFEISSDDGRALDFTLLVTHVYDTESFEGVTADPVRVSLERPYLGTVGGRQFSYYRFMTDGRKSYRISLKGTHSDLSWVLFDRWVFDIILHDCDAHPGAKDESCPLSGLWPDTEYFMLVSERSGVPGTFRLLVEGR